MRYMVAPWKISHVEAARKAVRVQIVKDVKGKK
jgi:hypothetical protein